LPAGVLALLRTLADSLSSARQAFRIWRRTRPFWGGLLVTGGAGEILMSEHGPISLVIHIGIQGLAGYLIPLMLLLCGVLLWFNPAQRAFYSLLAIVLALGSWITSNLGGFFIGMLLGLVGGALAFAWATGSGDKPLRWFRGDPQILQPSWGLELVLRPTAMLPPPRRAVGSIESAGTAFSSSAHPSPAVIVFGSEEASDGESGQSGGAFDGLHQLACRLGEAAGQRRVDGERVGEVVDAEAPLDRQRNAQNQLAGPRRHDDAAEHGSAATPGDDLDEAIPEGLHLRPGIGRQR
jgi:hypothetical protein